MQSATRRQKEMSEQDKKKLLALQHTLGVLQDSDDFDRLKQIMAKIERLLDKYREH
jgi:hypothetical protein